MRKAKSWEYTAVDLVYLNKDPVTIAVVPRGTDLDTWIAQNVEKPKLGEHCFIYTSDITLH